MSRRANKKPTVAVGTRVRVPLLWHTMEAEVIEHRGFIGVGGREMIRIQPLDPTDDRGPFEVPVEEVEIVLKAEESGCVTVIPGVRRKTNLPNPLPVGSRVRVQLPHSVVDMRVVEDRGIVKGRQIVRVRPLDETYIPGDFELPADEVELLALPPGSRERAA
jgi:hypothetical protein